MFTYVLLIGCGVTTASLLPIQLYIGIEIYLNRKLIWFQLMAAHGVTERRLFKLLLSARILDILCAQVIEVYNSTGMLM